MKAFVSIATWLSRRFKIKTQDTLEFLSFIILHLLFIIIIILFIIYSLLFYIYFNTEL